MSFEPLYLLKTVLIGLAVGIVSGGFGIGGGILATPFMLMFLSVTPHVAIGTSLAMIVPTAISGALSYLRNDLVSGQLAKRLSLPALLGTIFGSITTLFVNGNVLMLFIAVLLLATGLDFVTGFGNRFRNKRSVNGPKCVLTQEVVDKRAIIVGLACGFLSGLLGVGGGFLLIPAFVYLFNTSLKVAFGTSLLVVAAVSIPGTMIHVFEHHVNLLLALIMVLGSIPGAWLGSSLAMKIRERWLKFSFGLILIVLAIGFGNKEFQELLQQNVLRP